MQLGITLAEIEPEQSFLVIESMTLSLNEYIEAAAVLLNTAMKVQFGKAR
jgi:hypothetical protein